MDEARVQAYIESANYAGLATAASDFELDMSHADAAPELSAYVYKVHLLAHLLLNQLDEARFLWKRLPAPMRADAELAAIWAVGKQMWLRDHAAVQAAAGARAAWAQHTVGAMVAELSARYLERAFCALGLAYVSISADALASKLGVPAQRVRELAATHGWTADAASGLYTPAKPAADASAPSGSRHVEELQRLTNYVAHLDREVR